MVEVEAAEMAWVLVASGMDRVKLAEVEMNGKLALFWWCDGGILVAGVSMVECKTW